MDRESLSETDKRGDRVSKGGRMYLISPLGMPNIYQNMQTGNLSVLMVHVFHVTIALYGVFHQTSGPYLI